MKIVKGLSLLYLIFGLIQCFWRALVGRKSGNGLNDRGTRIAHRESRKYFTRELLDFLREILFLAVTISLENLPPLPQCIVKLALLSLRIAILASISLGIR
jgi:hypothetical protein